MFRFWLMKELMPLVFFLGFIALFFVVVICWATVEWAVQNIRNWRRKRGGKNED